MEEAALVTIRSSREADWAELCAIHDRARSVELAGRVASADLVPLATFDEAHAPWAGPCFVACDPRRVVGFVAIRPPALTWLYVDPAWHRRGIGRRLVQHVLPRLQPDGMVLCDAENEPARACFAACGFSHLAARFPGLNHGTPGACVRLTLPNSRYRDAPPRPTARALKLAGFTPDRPGQAVRGEDGVWRWV